MKTFNELFSLILNEYQKTGSIDTVINVVNMTPEQKDRILKAFHMIDAIEANAKSLSQAKEEGLSRKNWLAQQIMTTADAKNLSDKQTEEVFTEIRKSIVKVADNINKRN